jgi:hypothetical protein
VKDIIGNIGIKKRRKRGGGIKVEFDRQPL